MNGIHRVLSGSVLVAALLAPTPARAQAPGGLECGAGLVHGEDRGLVAVPNADVFCPLVADPRHPHTFLSYVTGEFPTLSALGYETDVGSIGLGDQFNFLRWGGPRSGDGIQIGLSGGVFAQFDLHSPSFDLINADYVVGIPITARRGPWSMRFRPYHQSSHMGDEFLLRARSLAPEGGPESAPDILDFAGAEPGTTAFDFEAIDVVVSREAGPLRVYGGGEWLYRRHPETLRDLVARGGGGGGGGAPRGRRLVFAVDLRSTEEYGWTPAWSARAGVELAVWRDADHPPRQWRILLEYYDGPPPYGRSFRESLRWLGVGLHLSR